ncbi:MULTISPECIES: BREX-2 system adenine-specific DNA-methyltransferase PglX [Streptomyces]|uniref:site-specific DNA-methyltransferase (adenine-specific) n=1 Tax=Streptomyces dengpaensis TaxID=2049881 RepID=A0ABM6SMV0_9ACTN|nr:MULTISPECIES: BREX-2 system adenine-specific DNA-methyltransferase PglX [Streptomyces]AVH55965.1 BREX-2 system adenine-specific DNA-methyltransferase PglX [Streptomyces dengpaensis]PIB12216.1 SAM-dependent methyltransferase [Streptomyces sp. HG99]
MIDRKALLEDLKKQVKAVETDLGKQVKAVAEVGSRLKGEYEKARKLGRTAATWNSWLDERVTQVAVAWVLGTVFVRFCEDNGLIPEPYVTAPGDDRRELALARFDDYVSRSQDPTYRGWLELAFAELGSGQAGRLLFDRRHNPLYQIPLSHDGARELVEFWRGRDESGALVHDFTDPLEEDGDGTRGWDTRFLGDLYQDLSEAARKTYALLQTPEFVEEFILDRTMDPAVREFGYEGLKMIDPTCGSGHFVLGAFRRLVRLWGEGQPGRDVHERVRAALDSVHGVDLNPFAVAIARFRLLVAAMAASGVTTMAGAGKYEWPIHLAVGDSLIKHRHTQGNLFDGLEEEGADELAEFKYETEDVHEHPDILRAGRYHVVVGNPPYPTVKDKRLNQLYRDLYDACAGKYALSVPFAQRFFELAKVGGADSGLGYGMVGQITASSFMKREFGRRLIEDYFAHKVELTEVIDTSGAYIPGHGTPTVMLIGKPRGGSGRSSTVRTIRGVLGEPSSPKVAENGLVWRAIVEHIDEPGAPSKWVSIGDLDRDRYFGQHPWMLADGSLETVETLQAASQQPLSSVAEAIGSAAITGDDELYVYPHPTATWAERNVSPMRPFVEGDQVRDWVCDPAASCIFPVGVSTEERERIEASMLWRGRKILRSTLYFGETKEQRGMAWSDYAFSKRDRLNSPRLLSFSFVATHNHFVLDRGGRVFNKSAPVIKLRDGANEEGHLQLLGTLNSSTAGFWMKQVSHNMGSTVDSKGARQSTLPFDDFYQFNSTPMLGFPLPATHPTLLATALDDLGRGLSATTPSTLVTEASPTATALRKASAAWHSRRARMIALQEELDWQVYSLYNLHPDDLRVSEDPASPDIPELNLGERAFEIVLARRVAAGEASDEWFKRHGSTPITEIPDHWPAAYREVVQKRIDAIESSRAIGMVERPEYKRRWATEGWDALQEKALRAWLLDRIEKREHWYDENGMPTLVTLSRLTDTLSRDEDFVSVAKIYAPRKELPTVVAELMTDEHVPFLSALRYKPSGLKKREDWEHVWELQRQEDAAPDEPAKKKIRDSIPVPPKYTSADFLRPSYWRARGKLDVPKERFISFGNANVPTPDLYGWAGWDHREQAYAIDTYIATREAMSTEEVTPFLAGLLELQPWLEQWHNEVDPTFGVSPAAFIKGDRQMAQGEHGLTDEQLKAWRPAAATRGRRTAKN